MHFKVIKSQSPLKELMFYSHAIGSTMDFHIWTICKYSRTMTHVFFSLFELREKLIWPICSWTCLENLNAFQTPAIHALGMPVFPHAN